VDGMGAGKVRKEEGMREGERFFRVQEEVNLEGPQKPKKKAPQVKKNQATEKGKKGH